MTMYVDPPELKEYAARSPAAAEPIATSGGPRPRSPPFTTEGRRGCSRRRARKRRKGDNHGRSPGRLRT